MTATLVILIVFFSLITAAYIYLAGFISGTYPNLYKKYLQIPDMTEVEVSDFMNYWCKKTKRNDNWLINYIRTVQRKTKQDETVIEQKLLDLGHACMTAGDVGGQDTCIMTEWDVGECILTDDATCGPGTSTRTRNVKEGTCTEPLTQEDACSIACSIEGSNQIIAGTPEIETNFVTYADKQIFGRPPHSSFVHTSLDECESKCENDVNCKAYMFAEPWWQGQNKDCLLFDYIEDGYVKDHPGTGTIVGINSGSSVV
jgi:hypothetical protein